MEQTSYSDKRGPFGKAKKISSKAPPTPAAPTESTPAPNQRRIEKEILDTILGNKRLDYSVIYTPHLKC